MKQIRKRLTFANVLSVIALFVALGGAAYAASKINGKLIKPNSIPGNRLKKHTLTGSQINLAKLGTVPSASNASNASNANTLGGQAPSAFEPASNWTRSGLIKAASGQTVPLASFGPFSLQLKCVAVAGTEVEGQVFATSTEANSDGYGTEMATAGTSYDVLRNGPSETFSENDDNAADFFTPSGKTYLADLTVGENYLGAACFANALVSAS